VVGIRASFAVLVLASGCGRLGFGVAEGIDGSGDGTVVEARSQIVLADPGEPLADFPLLVCSTISAPRAT
jgi:hypothetical protein